MGRAEEIDDTIDELSNAIDRIQFNCPLPSDIADKLQRRALRLCAAICNYLAAAIENIQHGTSSNPNISSLMRKHFTCNLQRVKKVCYGSQKCRKGGGPVYSRNDRLWCCAWTRELESYTRSRQTCFWYIWISRANLTRPRRGGKFEALQRMAL
jgi:hypothetical protein